MASQRQWSGSVNRPEITRDYGREKATGMEPWAVRTTLSGPAKLFESKTRVLEDLEEQALGEISGMHRNHQRFARSMLKNEMRASLTRSAIALTSEEAD